MPTRFDVDHALNAIFTTATGIVSLPEIRDHLRAKVESGVLCYAELFDARDVSLDLSISDLAAIAGEVRQVMGANSPRKTAVVTNNNFIYGLALTYRTMVAAASSQFEIFKDFDAAREWILEAQDQTVGG